MSWTRATTLDELSRRGALVFKHGRHQLAIIQTGERCHAIDNRCPHEGYPLSQGTVDEACVLTCNWHNWKFDLASGRNLWGGDHVRVYPVELRGSEVWVDLGDPPPEQLREQALAGLREAFDERDHGFIARQLVRLAAAGFDPASEAVPLAIAWCAPRLEWGLTHAIAATADWLELHDRHPGEGRAQLEKRIVYLCEAIEHMAHDGLREPERPFPAPIEHEGRFDHEAFLDEVEAGDEAAIARVRGALKAKLSFAQLERSLVHSALRHYAGFGHALIYVGMIGELIARFGEAVADPALSALVRHHLYATREDLIPEFRGLADAIAAFPGDAPLDAPTGRGPGPIPQAEIDELIAAPLARAFEWVSSHASSHGIRATWDALLRACASNMLRFDLRRAGASAVKVADNVGWLDFTHALTFASAARIQCTKFPQLWPNALLQLSCFCARNRRFRDESIELADWQVADEAGLFAEIEARLLDHGMPLPVYPAHILKTSRAVRRELGQVSPQTRALLLAALNRFVHSPIQQRHARRNVHQAIGLVGWP